MSEGTTRSDWEAQLAAWYAAYDEIEVEISGPDEILTIIGSDVHPYLQGDRRTSWTIRASGVDAGTGVTETFYERVEPLVLGPDLRFLGVESGRIVFIGNGETQPLSIGLPILLADASYDVYGAWPFGQHGGGHAEDGHGGIDFEYQPGSFCYAAADGEVIEVRLNDGQPPSIQWVIVQQIRPGVNVQYGHIADPPIVSVGDVLTAGDIVGIPSVMPGDSHAMIHFSIGYQEQQQGNGDMCPIPWFNAAAAADWDVIWSLSHYSEELAEPLECNDREASTPYVATWNLETAGATAGPDAILFLREDGYAYNYVYTFFDALGSVYETGVTEWMTSPTTLGLRFIADCTGNITFAAVDVISEEMQIKLDPMGMPADMSGAATYLWGGAEASSSDVKLYVSNVFENTVSIIDLSNGSTDTISVGTQPGHMTYSAMSDKILLGNLGASELHTLSTTSESLTATLSISGPAASMDIHPMTNKVYALDTPGTEIHVIDMATGAEDGEFTIGYDLQDIRLDADNNIAYATDFGDLLNPLPTEGVVVYNTCDDTVITLIPLSDAPHGLAVDSAQGRLYVTRLEDDSISIIDINPSSATYHQEVGLPITVGDQPEWIALSQKHGKGYVTNLGDGTVSVIDLNTNNVIGSPIIVGIQPFFVITDDDSDLAYVTNLGSDTVSVIDMDTDAVVETFNVGSGPVGMTLIK
jgi:YVTN family beta-propeller protein